MRLLLFSLALAAILPGCELNQGSEDVQQVPADDTSDGSGEVGEPRSPFEPEPEPEPDPPDGPPAPATGCDWAAGAWRFTDCQTTPDGADLQFMLTGCTVQVVSNSAGLAGAFGQAFDGGLTLSFPNGLTCHGFFDGEYLTGACSNPSSAPCWFVAQKQ